MEPLQLDGAYAPTMVRADLLRHPQPERRRMSSEEVRLASDSSSVAWSVSSDILRTEQPVVASFNPKVPGSRPGRPTSKTQDYGSSDISGSGGLPTSVLAIVTSPESVTSVSPADEMSDTQITGTGEVSRRERSPSKPWLRAAITSDVGAQLDRTDLIQMSIVRVIELEFERLQVFLQLGK